MKDKTNAVGHAAYWSKRILYAAFFVAGATVVLGYYCNMLPVVEPVQPIAIPGYSSSIVKPAAVSGYSSGDEH